MWFERIKRFYEQGLWTKSMVADGVRYGKIDSEQYKEITGEEWETITD